VGVNWSEAMRGRVWAPAAAAAALGTAMGLWLPIWLPAVELALALCLAVAVVQSRRGRTVAGPATAWLALLLVLLWRAALVAAPDPPPPLQPYLPRTQPPILRLLAVNEPEWTVGGHRVLARWLATCESQAPAPGLRCERRWGLVRVDVTGRDVRVHIGDTFRVPAFASPAPGYGNPGAYDLRRQWHLAGIVSEVRVHKPELIAVEPDPGTPLDGWQRGVDSVLRAIGSLRRHLATCLTTRVPGRPGAVLAALALGDRSSADPAFQDWLSATGTTHVMAVSGSHLAIAVWLARAALQLLLCRLTPGLLRRRPLDSWLALPCVAVAWGYGLLTGAAASTLRAAWMATVLLLGRAAGRRLDLGESLGAAITVLLVWDPATLADIGFGLSVLGVLGLAWAGSGAQGDAQHLVGRARSLWRTCLAPSATTAPMVFYTFGALPLASPLANALLVPFTALLLPFALLAMAIAAVPQLPPSLADLLEVACRWSVAPLELGMHIPRSALPVWRLEGLAALAAGLAVPLVLAAVWHGAPWRRRAVLGVALAGLCIGWCTWRDRLPDGTLRAFVLDVGHGDCTLLEFPDGSTMLVDGGGELGDDGRVGRLAVVPFLLRRGVSRIDRMVLTHAHPDHENGLLAVARALPVGELWWNGQMPKGSEHEALMAELKRQGARWRSFAPAPTGPRSFVFGGVQLRILWPVPERAPYEPKADMNDNSLVLELSTGAHRLLLAGDIEAPTEAVLCASGALRHVDVLKVPHHGSRTSSTSGLLAALGPQLAIAGARPWGSLPFPHPQIRERYAAAGIPLWTTAQGIVELRLDADGVSAQQGNRWLRLPASAPPHINSSISLEKIKSRPAPGEEDRATTGMATTSLAHVRGDHCAVLALRARQEMASLQRDRLQHFVRFASRHGGLAYTARGDRCQNNDRLTAAGLTGLGAPAPAGSG